MEFRGEGDDVRIANARNTFIHRIIKINKICIIKVFGKAITRLYERKRNRISLFEIIMQIEHK